MTDLTVRIKRQLIPLGAVAWLGLAGCTASVGDEDNTAASAPVEVLPVEILAERLCGLPGNAEFAEHAVEVDDGIMDYEAWAAKPSFQAALPQLGDLLERFATRTLDPVLDHERQQIVVPIDAELLATGELQHALDAARLPLPVRLQTACRSVAELRAAERTVLKLDWHPEAHAVRFDMYRDSEHAVLVTTFDRADEAREGAKDAEVASDWKDTVVSAAGPLETEVAPPEPVPVTEVAQALRYELGELVRIRFGSVGRHSRSADAQPHRGAAAVRDRTVNFCTSGPIVYRNGMRSSVTAGHCFNDGVSVFSGSGSLGYGLTAGKASFPNYDMIRIEASGQSFQRQIWSDPGTPTTRTQTRKLNASANMLICTSGANVNTRAICNIRVASSTCTICDGGCTTGMMRGTKTNVILNRSGDSGAVMYSADPNPPSGVTNGAVIHGMAVGSSDNSDVCWHRMSEIESQLGVTIATF